VDQHPFGHQIQFTELFSFATAHSSLQRSAGAGVTMDTSMLEGKVTSHHCARRKPACLISAAGTISIFSTDSNPD
jgi:hypothetical protein